MKHNSEKDCSRLIETKNCFETAKLGQPILKGQCNLFENQQISDFKFQRKISN